MKVLEKKLINLQHVLKIGIKFPDDHSGENEGETFCLVCKDGYFKSTCMAGKRWLPCTQLQIWIRKKRTNYVSLGYMYFSLVLIISLQLQKFSGRKFLYFILFYFILFHVILFLA